MFAPAVLFSIGCAGLSTVFTVQSQAYFSRTSSITWTDAGMYWVAFADLFVEQPQILAAAVAMLLGFGQVMHDSFADQILGQRLPPAALLRLWPFRLVLLWLAGSGIVFFLIRIAGFPKRFEQCQLPFGELFALAVALRVEQFAQQTPVLILFRSLVAELLS